MSRASLLLALVLVVAAGATVLYAIGRSNSIPAYASVSTIARDMNAQGVECTDLELLDEQHPTLKEFGLCYLDDGEYEADIYLFESAGDVVVWLDELTKQIDEGILVGPNWLITAGTEANARKIQEAVGGELVPD